MAVFHPDHDELHGQTVVLFTSGPLTFVGRWDHAEGEFIRINDAAMHDADATDKDRDTWLRETKTYGVRVEHPVLTVPQKDVERVVTLRDA